MSNENQGGGGLGSLFSFLGAGPGGVNNFTNSVGEILRGLKLAYDELCKIAMFNAPPISQKTFSGTTANTTAEYAAADVHQLSQRAKRFDVLLYDNNAFISWASQPGQFTNDEQEYIAPGFYSLPAAARAVRIRKVVGGTAARYSVSSWT